MRILALLLAIAWPFGLSAQVDPAIYGKTIQSEDAKSYMNILASDALEGRMTGSRGQKMAAALIADSFHRFGLLGLTDVENPYYYEIPFERVAPGETYIKIGDSILRNFEDVAYWGSSNTGTEQTSRVVAVGDGSNADKMDVKGNVALVTTDAGFQRLQNIAGELYEKGAELVLLSISKNKTEFQGLVRQFRSYFEDPSISLKNEKDEDNSYGVIFISPEISLKILGTSAKSYNNALAKSQKGDVNALNKFTGEISYKISTHRSNIISENVVGFVEGTEYPEEVLVITAHYDHLGKKGDNIYYGADDNGSGTTALLEIAEAFGIAAANGDLPKRSILFMALTGEEEGLLGSLYYSENPLFPLKNTVVNLNMDMVGHLDEAHPDDPNFVSVVGSDWLSSDLHEIHENANSKYVNIELDYTYNSKDHPERFYYRSDQYNFAKHDIPVIFYTSGDHEDYHQPTDTKENIKYDRIESVARLVFYTAWDIANREERIKVDMINPK